MLWFFSLLSVALAGQVEVALQGGATLRSGSWTLEDPESGMVLEENMPTARRRAWLLQLYMGEPLKGADGLVSEIPFTLKLEELRLNRKGEIKRRDLVARGEVTAYNQREAHIQGSIADSKGQHLEDFDLQITPRL